MHICLTYFLDENPFCENQATGRWGWNAGMCHEPFTSTWQRDWEAGGKPEASFSSIRYLPLLPLFCSSSPKCLTSVNKKYRQQVQARHLPTCRSHLAALEDRVLQCTAPSSPIKAVLSIFCCPLACHSATQLRNHVLTARAQGKGTLWGSQDGAVGRGGLEKQ